MAGANPASLDLEEELVRETKLCATCRPMFGTISAFPTLTMEYAVGRHHASCETLRQSVEAGCTICTMLYERWQRYLISSETPYFTPRIQLPRSMSFYFHASKPPEMELGFGPRDAVPGPYSCDKLLHLTRCMYQ